MICFYLSMASYGFKKIEKNDGVYWKREICGIVIPKSKNVCSNTVRNGGLCHLHIDKNVQKYDVSFGNINSVPIQGEVSVENGLLYLTCDSCIHCDNYVKCGQLKCRFCTEKEKKNNEDDFFRGKTQKDNNQKIQKKKRTRQDVEEKEKMILLSENSSSVEVEVESKIEHPKILDLPFSFDIKTPGAPKKPSQKKKRGRVIQFQIPRKNNDETQKQNIAPDFIPLNEEIQSSDSDSIPLKKKIMKSFHEDHQEKHEFIPLPKGFQNVEEKTNQHSKIDKIRFVQMPNANLNQRMESLEVTVSKMGKTLNNMNRFIRDQLSSYNSTTHKSGAIVYKMHQLSKQIDNIDSDVQKIRRVTKEVGDDVYELTRSKKMAGQELANVIYGNNY